jgi:hypothetical protein
VLEVWHTCNTCIPIKAVKGGARFSFDSRIFFTFILKLNFYEGQMGIPDYHWHIAGRPGP